MWNIAGGESRERERGRQREVGCKEAKGKQGRVTELPVIKARHEGIGIERGRGSYNLVRIKNDWWRRGVIKAPLSYINIK